MLIQKFETAREFVKKFIHKNKQFLANSVQVSKMASVVALLVIIPLNITAIQNKTYHSDIKFAASDQIVKAPEQKIQVISLPSRDQAQNSSGSISPDAMKAMIQEIAPEYGLDWKLVYAIGYYESGNYNSSLARRNLNFFGRKASSRTWAAWNTPEEAIRDQCAYLKEHYFDRGLNTPYEIGPIYCEGNTWAGKIISVMNRL